MTGVAEVDEPFPVGLLCHLLQQHDPPSVVLDQIVDRPEHINHDALRSKTRNLDREVRKGADRNPIYRGSGDDTAAHCLSPGGTKHQEVKEPGKYNAPIWPYQSEPPAEAAAEAVWDEGVAVQRSFIGEDN